MEFSLARTFRKFKDAYDLRDGRRALVVAVTARDGDAILSIVKKNPALLDAQLELVPGQVDRLNIFELMLHTGREETAAALATAFPLLLAKKDGNGDTLPLRYFRASNNENALGTLAKIVQDTSVTDSGGNTLLHLAAAHGPRQTNIALKMSPALNAPNDKGQTPLMLAVASGDTTSVALLLHEKPDIHATDADGLNAVMYAIRHSALDSAVLLLNRGGVVDFTDPAIESQRRVATMEMNLDFLQALDTRHAAQMAENKAQAEKEALRAHKDNIAGITATMKKGVGRVRAPKTASFTRK